MHLTSPTDAQGTSQPTQKQNPLDNLTSAGQISLDRRNFLASMGLGVAAVAGAPLLRSTTIGKLTTVPFLPYSTDSFFKSSVIGAPVDATATSSLRSFLKNFTKQKYSFPLIKGLDGNVWGMPYAQGTSADPVWTLTGKVPTAVSDLSTTGFHAPSWLGQQLTGTTDSPFIVMDMVRGITVYGFHGSVSGTYQISVRDAGYFVHTSNGLDKRNPLSDSTKNWKARGTIPDAMVIRRDRMDYAIANNTGLGYVLHMCFVETDTAAGFCSPMVACEPNKTGWGAEGRRIAIDPAVDLTTRGLSPAALAVAMTLQRHGCYLGDNAGSGCSLKAEQATSQRNPWAGLDFHTKSLTGLTWDDWIVLPAGWQ